MPDCWERERSEEGVEPQQLGNCVTVLSASGDRTPLGEELRSVEAFLACLRDEVDGRRCPDGTHQNIVCVFGQGCSESFIVQCSGLLTGRYRRATIRRMTWG